MTAVHICKYCGVETTQPDEECYANPKQDKIMKFKIGDKVQKPKGYKFDGIVVAVFHNTVGEVRIVAELIDNGMLHIFSESQLELLEYPLQ